MGQEPGTSGTAVGAQNDPEQIREQIEQTREELGETVEALAAKTDVKKRAQEKLGHTKAAATEKKDELLGKAREISPDQAVATASQAGTKVRENPFPFALAAAFAAGLLIGRLLGQRTTEEE